VERVVEEVRSRASATSDGPWGFLVGSRAGGGIAGVEGPSVLVGIELGVERRLVEGLGARVRLDGRRGPLDSGDPAHAVQTLFISAGLGAVYLFDLVPGAFRLGPTLDLRATWTTLEVASMRDTTQTFSQWSFRADLGLELRVALGSGLELLASGAAAVTPLRRLLTLRSSGETLLATPFLAWDASLGVSASMR
jgi:hypothetical protein